MESGSDAGLLKEDESGNTLARAHRIQMAAADLGFDWGDITGPLAKLSEELNEVAEAVADGDHRAITSEIGDLLFSVVNLARLAGVDPSEALEGANSRFSRRFEGVQRLAGERGLPMPGASLAELDLLWDEIKAEERLQPTPPETGGLDPSPGVPPLST